MGSTYLSLCNAVLSHMNGIPLTLSNFNQGRGAHAAVKSAVNFSIREINQSNFQWPFNHQYGTQVLTPLTQVYTLPANYKVIDWDSFYIEGDEMLSVSARNLSVMEYDEWKFRRRESDMKQDNTGGTPETVFRTQAEEFGVSPIPDKAYTVKFEYWSVPAPLVNATDTTNIPSQFDYIIVSGALHHIYKFYDNIEQSETEGRRFRELMKDMRTIKINSYEYAYDTRIRTRGHGYSR